MADNLGEVLANGVITNTTRRKDFAVYDSLPPILRAILREMPVLCSSEEAKMLLNKLPIQRVMGVYAGFLMKEFPGYEPPRRINGAHTTAAFRRSCRRK